MTPAQREIFNTVLGSPGTTLATLAAQLGKTPAGIGLTLASLVRLGTLLKQGDAYSVAGLSIPSPSAPPLPPSAGSKDLRSILEQVRSRLLIHRYAEDDSALDKRAGYLATCGVDAVMKDMIAEAEGSDIVPA